MTKFELNTYDQEFLNLVSGNYQASFKLEEIIDDMLRDWKCQDCT